MKTSPSWGRSEAAPGVNLFATSVPFEAFVRGESADLARMMKMRGVKPE
jgi:hypothetical protein